MAETTTRATAASVEDYLARRAKKHQLADSQALIALMSRLTGEPPRMWGPSIVGFGRYTYRYDSGHSGESCLIGFALRGAELVVYLIADDASQPGLLERLGPHRMGKACLYFKRLADLDLAVLEALLRNSMAELQRRHGGSPAGG